MEKHDDNNIYIYANKKAVCSIVRLFNGVFFKEDRIKRDC